MSIRGSKAASPVETVTDPMFRRNRLARKDRPPSKS
jgi:hypothetical protein